MQTFKFDADEMFRPIIVAMSRNGSVRKIRVSPTLAGLVMAAFWPKVKEEIDCTVNREPPPGRLINFEGIDICEDKTVAWMAVDWEKTPEWEKVSDGRRS